jgi:ABC-type multidrug transport system fused ATPase/permease subunit
MDGGFSIEVFSLVFGYLRKYAAVLSVTILSMLLLVGVQLLAPWLIKQMIAIVTNPALEKADMQQITNLALLALGAYVFRIGLQYLRSYMAHIAGWGVWGGRAVAALRTRAAAFPAFLRE